VKVRVVTETRRVPRLDGLVVVQVAETLDERTALARRMLAGLLVLEGAMVGFAALLVWPAVGWGLRPVTSLRKDLERRSQVGADFTPLETHKVPQELRGLVDGFNGLLGRLDGAVTGMRRFTADASHQMRTPLTVLRTHLSVLRQHGTETPEGKASMADLDAAVDRLRRLLTQLIALARAEETAAGSSASQLKPFRLDDIAAEAARAVAPHAIENDIDLHFEGPDAPVKVHGNPVFATEIVTNLLENAIWYNRPGGVVAMRLRQHDRQVRLEVEDDGPGIPAKDREHVFQRFHRLARDQEHVGSGLGLSIVRTLAASMNARIELSEGAGGKGLLVGVVFEAA
jgi:two-component system sensor histidine kinase TctE